MGNLICPVEFRLGETIRIAVASVPEETTSLTNIRASSALFMRW
jgi:Ni2+-binding GTPase involved in maturation of urease and hydrogenase